MLSVGGLPPLGFGRSQLRPCLGQAPIVWCRALAERATGIVEATPHGPRIEIELRPLLAS